MTLPGEIELDVDFDRVDKENAAEAEKAQQGGACLTPGLPSRPPANGAQFCNAASGRRTEQALALLERIYADRRRPARPTTSSFSRRSTRWFRPTANSRPTRSTPSSRKYYPDDVSRAIGWMTASPRTRWSGRSRGTGACQSPGRPRRLDGADAIYTAWRDWDGDNLPLSMRIDRQWQRVAFFRNRMKPLARSAGGAMLQRPESQLTEGQLRERQRYLELAKYETRATEEWVADLRRGITECATANQRASAFERLMNEEWGTKTKDERIAALDRLIEDKFLANPRASVHAAHTRGPYRERRDGLEGRRGARSGPSAAATGAS